MTITISDQELQNFKGTLQLYYTAAVNQYIEDLRPFVAEHLQKNFKKETEFALAALREKLAKAPHLVII